LVLTSFVSLLRPSYPIPALEHIHQIVSKTPARDLEIVEHGAGTVRSLLCRLASPSVLTFRSFVSLQGLFTQLLTAPPPGYPNFPIDRLTALEPSKSMRAAFDKVVLPSTKADVRCLSGTFSAFPAEVEDGSVDVLVIAQAFHWSDPNYEASIAAIGKALKQDGVAIFIWNMEDEKAAPWVRQLRALYQVRPLPFPPF
jgi:SAM-dependent methyltransferase